MPVGGSDDVATGCVVGVLLGAVTWVVIVLIALAYFKYVRH